MVLGDQGSHQSGLMRKEWAAQPESKDILKEMDEKNHTPAWILDHLVTQCDQERPFGEVSTGEGTSFLYGTF